ncbi:MAG: hypothetical protein B6D56_08240, partial [Candidatus Omnitrophica bacterium 4484_70.1]
FKLALEELVKEKPRSKNLIKEIINTCNILPYKVEYIFKQILENKSSSPIFEFIKRKIRSPTIIILTSLLLIVPSISYSFSCQPPFSIYQRTYIDLEERIIFRFDDGPCSQTPQILSLLEKYKIKNAQFYFIGRNISPSYITREVEEALRSNSGGKIKRVILKLAKENSRGFSAEKARIIKRIIEDGYTLGIHTFTHPIKDKLKKYSPLQFLLELVATQQAINLSLEKIGEKPYFCRVFATPGGEKNLPPILREQLKNLYKPSHPLSVYRLLRIKSLKQIFPHISELDSVRLEILGGLNQAERWNIDSCDTRPDKKRLKSQKILKEIIRLSSHHQKVIILIHPFKGGWQKELKELFQLIKDRSSSSLKREKDGKSELLKFYKTFTFVPYWKRIKEILLAVDKKLGLKGERGEKLKGKCFSWADEFSKLIEKEKFVEKVEVRWLYINEILDIHFFVEIKFKEYPLIYALDRTVGYLSIYRIKNIPHSYLKKLDEKGGFFGEAKFHPFYYFEVRKVDLFRMYKALRASSPFIGFGKSQDNIDEYKKFVQFINRLSGYKLKAFKEKFERSGETFKETITHLCYAQFMYYLGLPPDISLIEEKEEKLKKKLLSLKEKFISALAIPNTLDLTFEFKENKEGEVELIKIHQHIGGKAINATKVIQRLGYRVNLCCVLSKKEVGRQFYHFLIEEEILPQKIYINEDIRVYPVFSIITKEGKREEFRFSSAGPEISDIEYRDILIKTFGFLSSVKEGSILIGGGRGLRNELGKYIWPDIIKMIRDMKLKIIFDFTLGLTPQEIGEIISSHPFMIKPNLDEFAYIIGKRLNSGDIKLIAQEAQKLAKDKGIEIVVVSLGERGAVLATENSAFYAQPPEVEVKSTVGCGDALIGGMALGLCLGKDLADALRFGVSCGTVTATKEGTEVIGSIKEAEKLQKKIKVYKIASSSIYKRILQEKYGRKFNLENTCRKNAKEIKEKLLEIIHQLSSSPFKIDNSFGKNKELEKVIKILEKTEVFLKKSQYDEIINLLKPFVRKELSAELKYTLFRFLGLAYFKRGSIERRDFSEAEKSFREVLLLSKKIKISEKEKKDCILSYVCALSQKYYLEKMNIQKAIKYLKNISREYPEDWRIKLSLGDIYLSLFWIEWAERLFKEVLSIKEVEKDNMLVSQIYGRLGICYLRKEKYEEAREYFRKSCSLFSDDVSFYNLACVEYFLGNKEEALKILEELREKGDRTREVLSMLAKLYLHFSDFEKVFEIWKDYKKYYPQDLELDRFILLKLEDKESLLSLFGEKILKFNKEAKETFLKALKETGFEKLDLSVNFFEERKEKKRDCLIRLRQEKLKAKGKQKKKYSEKYKKEFKNYKFLEEILNILESKKIQRASLEEIAQLITEAIFGKDIFNRELLRKEAEKIFWEKIKEPPSLEKYMDDWFNPQLIIKREGHTLIVKRKNREKEISDVIVLFRHSWEKIKEYILTKYSYEGKCVFTAQIKEGKIVNEKEVMEKIALVLEDGEEIFDRCGFKHFLLEDKEDDKIYIVTAGKEGGDVIGIKEIEKKDRELFIFSIKNDIKFDFLKKDLIPILEGKKKWKEDIHRSRKQDLKRIKEVLASKNKKIYFDPENRWFVVVFGGKYVIFHFKGYFRYTGNKLSPQMLNRLEEVTSILSSSSSIRKKENLFVELQKIKGTDKKAIGERIKVAMEMKGIDVRQMAERLGVAKSTVYSWINSQCLPNFSHFKKLCEILEIPLGLICGGKKEISVFKDLPELIKAMEEGKKIVPDSSKANRLNNIKNYQGRQAIYDLISDIRLALEEGDIYLDIYLILKTEINPERIYRSLSKDTINKQNIKRQRLSEKTFSKAKALLEADPQKYWGNLGMIKLGKEIGCNYFKHLYIAFGNKYGWRCSGGTLSEQREILKDLERYYCEEERLYSKKQFEIFKGKVVPEAMAIFLNLRNYEEILKLILEKGLELISKKFEYFLDIVLDVLMKCKDKEKPQGCVEKLLEEAIINNNLLPNQNRDTSSPFTEQKNPFVKGNRFTKDFNASSSLKEKIIKLTESLGYSYKTGEELFVIVEGWEEIKEEIPPETNSTEKEYLLDLLAIKIKNEFGSDPFVSSLEKVIKEKKANDLGYTQLFYVLAKAIGLDVEIAEVGGVSPHISLLARLSTEREKVIDLYGNIVKSSEKFEHYWILRKDDISILNSLWEVIEKEKENKLSEARVILEKIVEKYPHISLLYMRLGIFYQRINKHRKAIK